MEYYIHGECPKCGADVYDRAVNYVEHNGLPVFGLDDMSQYSMTCKNDVYRNDDGDEIDTDAYHELDEDAQDAYRSGICEYAFGTGDIDIIGEDD